MWPPTLSFCTSIYVSLSFCTSIYMDSARECVYVLSCVCPYPLSVGVYHCLPIECYMWLHSINPTYDFMFGLKLLHELNVFLTPFRIRSGNLRLLWGDTFSQSYPQVRLFRMSRIIVLCYPINTRKEKYDPLYRWVSQVSHTVLIFLIPHNDFDGNLCLGWWPWSGFLRPRISCLILP